MPRLGELLVRAGRVTPSQIENAARAQVAYGGRLGTNLVDLGHLDLDELAGFLARQHRMAAAERIHFDRADSELQAQLPAAIAARFGVVPIARVANDLKKIAIATLGPLTAQALDEIARALRCTGDDLVLAVAAELRILYNLERVYKIPRPTRFLRIQRGGTREISIARVEPGDPSDFSDDELAIPITAEDEGGTPTDGDTGPPAAMEPLELSDSGVVEEAPDPNADHTERRRFVRTIAEDTEPPSTHGVGATSLGRINLRRLMVAAATDGEDVVAATMQDALRAVRRCRDREKIGTLAVACLDHQGGVGIDAAVLFIARGPVAVGWKGFARGAEVDFDQIAVPLDQPSVIARGRTVVRRIAPGQETLTAIDRRLIAALSFESPTFGVAAPITIRSHVIGYVYGQGRGDATTAEALIVEVADATAAALTSLLQAAQR